MDTQGLLVIVLGSVAAVVVLSIAAVNIAQVVTRGRKHRDIMAYVAEGSVTPEDAAALIELSERADMRQKVLSTANWDSDWDRWRDTVRELFSEDLSKASKSPEPSAKQSTT